ATTGNTSATDSSVSSNTAYLYRVRANGGAPSSVDLATTVAFTTLNAGSVVQMQHVMELRAAVNAVRVLAGLATPPFTDALLTSGASSIKAVHVTELRNRLAEARADLGLTPLSFTDTTVTA